MSSIDSSVCIHVNESRKRERERERERERQRERERERGREGERKTKKQSSRSKCTSIAGRMTSAYICMLRCFVILHKRIGHSKFKTSGFLTILSPSCG